MTKPFSCEQLAVGRLVCTDHRGEKQDQAVCETHVFVRAACAFVGASIGTVLHGSLYGPSRVSLVRTYGEHLSSGDRLLQHLHTH